MKKKIVIIDTLLIVITYLLMVYIDNLKSYGLAALENVGKVVLCLIGLGIEATVLIVVAIVAIIQRIRAKYQKKEWG